MVLCSARASETEHGCGGSQVHPFGDSRRGKHTLSDLQSPHRVEPSRQGLPFICSTSYALLCSAHSRRERHYGINGRSGKLHISCRGDSRRGKHSLSDLQSSHRVEPSRRGLPLIGSTLYAAWYRACTFSPRKTLRITSKGGQVHLMYSSRCVRACVRARARARAFVRSCVRACILHASTKMPLLFA